MPAAKDIEWPPTNLPAKFPLTPRRDGYCKSINGKVRWVCGKLPPKAALNRYHERLRAGHFDELVKYVIPGAGGQGISVSDLCNEYLAWLAQRVETGRPMKLSLRTFEDYRIAIKLFADTTVHGQELRELDAVGLGPVHFSAYAAEIPGKSPYTAARYIAPIRAMYQWASDNDRIDHPVKFGSDFRKPSSDDLRTARADIEKAFSVDEIRALLSAARSDAWQAILLLCINGGCTNADIGKFTRKHIDLDTGIVQFTRGKKGRAWRKFPLWPITIEALRAYKRPAAADDSYGDHFFLTRNGLPIVRMTRVNDPDGNLISASRQDGASAEFGKLQKAIGISKHLRRLSGMRTTFRTLVESLPEKDNDAIDLVMGHPRRHISSEYVESFPVEKLQRVVDHVFWSLFDGWTCPVDGPTPAGAPSTVL